MTTLAETDDRSREPPSTYILVPTFREVTHIRRLLEDIAAQSVTDHTTIVINSNPGDETSVLIAAAGSDRVIELPADPSIFWTGAIEIGQRHVLGCARPDDIVLMLNSDVRLDSDFLLRLHAIMDEVGRAMIAAATVDGDVFVSSGCRIISWPLALTEHLLVGPVRATASKPIPADMLAGRALAHRAQALHDVGVVASGWLPHYASDYEFTRRAQRRGYELYVIPHLRIANDSGNTGLKSSRDDTTLAMRLRGLTSMRSSSNVLYRTRFVVLTYPWYAIPTGLLVNWLKILLETLLGSLCYRLFTLRGIRAADIESGSAVRGQG